MIRALKSVRLLKLIMAGLFLLIIIFFSFFAGHAEAWFLNSLKLSNSFVSGTLSLAVSGPVSGEVEPQAKTNPMVVVVPPIDCQSFDYLITNTGSKRLLARAWFQGFWLQGYHKNTATAEGYYNGHRFLDTDSAYYLARYVAPEEYPGLVPPAPKYGFTHRTVMPPAVVSFSNLFPQATSLSSSLAEENLAPDTLAVYRTEVPLENLTYKTLLLQNTSSLATELNEEVATEFNLYCPAPDPEPGIDLKKFVSVDGGVTWHDADSLEGAPTIANIAPQFKFVVKNTGNVTLQNISVHDDEFGVIKEALPALAPGETVEYFYADENWLEGARANFSTDNITISLCTGSDSNWVPVGPKKLGTYFYYDKIIDPATETYPPPVSLCVDICVYGENAEEFSGAYFVFYAIFEGVQVTNGMPALNGWEHIPSVD